MDEWNNKLPERRLPFSKKRLPKKVLFSYILDYVIIIILLAIFAIIDKIEPFHQPFSLDNYTLYYPYAVHERVPVALAGLIAVIFPAVVIVVYTMVIDGIFSHHTPMPAARGGLKRLSGRYRFKDRLWELNCGLLGLGLSVCFAFTITGALKNAIGKPRPDIMSRCNIDPTDTSIPRYPLATSAMCKQDDEYIRRDGFKSFPSGHSSVSFAGLFYLSLYLAAKLHVLDSKGEVWKAFIVLVPCIAAALIAGSRIMDARHHPFDVLSGSLMGILVAWGAYRQYFPPLHESWRKGRAYPIRSWGAEPVKPPMIQVDDDVQPLRPTRVPTDEERAASSGFSSAGAVPGSDEHGGNVFRQQISQSQRRRQQEGAVAPDRADTLGSNYSTASAGYRGQLPGSSPFADNTHRHNGNNEAYDYSSSEDDGSYELQQTYTLSNPQGGVYNPVSGTLTDTGYHPPPGIQPNPTPPPPSEAPRQPTGDLADRNAVSVAPATQHV